MAATETVTLLVTSGRGPAECARALADFVAAMAEAATAAGLDLATDADGARPSASVVLSGPGAATFARRWTGNVQWTDASLRGRGARRNWYLAAILMPQRPEPAALDPRDVRIEAMRAGGPGGQHQNTTDSAVRAVHLPTGLSAIARDGRSQHANRALAIERLGRLLVAVDDRRALEADRQAWLARITVERGNPALCLGPGRTTR